MPRPKNHQKMLSQLVGQTVQGIQAAQAQYRKWTEDGWWLSGGAEYLATVNIAQAIHANVQGARYVTVEHNIKDTLTHTRGARKRVRQRVRLPKNGRFDVVVWTPKNHAAAVIEVKTRTLTWASVRGDVRRVCEALLKFDGLRWGLVAYYMDMEQGPLKSAEEKIKTRTLGIANRAKGYAHEKDIRCLRRRGRPRNVEFEDGSAFAWTAEVLVFWRK
ncbi:MAG: hypothetical protein OXH09_10885 [Gammaproteobacteria bacterium]|nr:hypothetical protein [Gammaproteobacteria bacterium]